MACLRATLTQTLEHGYAHHIQRLMVTGLFALLLAVEPRRVHEWYLAIYVDAVEWVEAPNTLAMSQYAGRSWISFETGQCPGWERRTDYRNQEVIWS